MTAGPFIMTNLEGLFSPFRDLEAEMDELRTMRRVSQIWREMERREQGAWMMFGRFFDRQMDEMNELTSATWDTGLFPHPQINRLNHSFSERGLMSNKNEGNVIVEFPDEKEIKITLEEPSVVITEVEDTAEEVSPTHTPDSSNSGASRNTSPIRNCLVSYVSDPKVVSESEPELSPYHVTSVNNTEIVEQTHTADLNKSLKIEKRLKKVDFSKMEVHFEPGSGKVNIVETNEKPPSNQLFRRKRRHRERSVRSESPKLNFVGSCGNESFENISSNTIHHDSRFATSNTNSNMRFTRLQNDLDLSIFNLRNTLFKNSINEFLIPTKSKNVLNSEDKVQEDDNIYTCPKMNNSPKEKVFPDKNVSTNRTSYLRSAFNVSSKLQDMIQNSVKNQIKIVKSHVDGIKEVNVDKVEKRTDNRSKFSPSPNSLSNTPKGRNTCLKRSTSKGKDLIVPVENNSNGIQRNGSKQSINDEKSMSKSKSVSRGDSLKKNSRVMRQESLRSTSSRGSINNESRPCQKKNNLKDSFRRDSNNKVNRTPSIGRAATNSLKRGGIYVDGRPGKAKGSTVTVICYSSGLKQSDNSNKNNSNNITVNKENISKNRLSRKDSLKSYCSKESLSSLPNKIAQNKKNDLGVSFLGKNASNKENSFESSEQASDSRLNQSSSRYSYLNFTGSVSNNNVCSKNAVYRNIPIYKDDTFNSEARINKAESVASVVSRTSKADSNVDNKHFSEPDINLKKDSFKTNKRFNHQDSSLFQPIKKEKTIHSSKSQVNDIKTPVAIRKKSNHSEPKRLTPLKEKNDADGLSKKITVDKSSNGKSNFIKSTKSSPSKFSLTSLRRSKEPLRSFEKISNGWVGRCNMSGIDRDVRSETKWGSSRLSEIKITNHINNLNEKSKGGTRDSTSPMSQSSVGSRITEHRQREAMMRLTRGYPSRQINTPSTSYLKQNIETRKRSRNVYTPSSISSQSSNILMANKRRPAQYVRTESVRSDTPVPCEPVYETLNCRQKAPTTSTLVKRNRHSNPCCNI